MNTSLTAVLALLAAPAIGGERPDMLRFTNGDQLRGGFAGLRQGPVIQWRHEDLATPAAFLFMLGTLLVVVFGLPLWLAVTVAGVGSTLFLYKGGLMADASLSGQKFAFERLTADPTTQPASPTPTEMADVEIDE